MMVGAEQQKLRQYLLGNLTEAEEEQVELRLLDDSAFGEEYDTVVDEIIDEYIEGKFSGEEFKKAATYFFKSPVRQEKLQFTQALHDYRTNAIQPRSNDPQPLPFPNKIQPWVFRAAAAIAAVAVLAGGFWLFRQQKSSPQNFATIILNNSASRRGEESEVRSVSLPPGVDGLKIVLELPDPTLASARYRGELENVNGEKRALEPLSQDVQSVTFLVRAAELKPERYALKLFAVNADGGEQRIPGNYFFKVE
jgi:anti-sigma factor RsiW